MARLSPSAWPDWDVQLIATVPASWRLTSRVDAAGEVWVCWQCDLRTDVSRVRNVSTGGMFLEFDRPLAKGRSTNLHFLVREGPIRANAEIRYTIPGEGLGLKFTAIERECGPQLAELLRRLRGVKRA